MGWRSGRHNGETTAAETPWPRGPARQRECHDECEHTLCSRGAYLCYHVEGDATGDVFVRVQRDL